MLLELTSSAADTATLAVDGTVWIDVSAELPDDVSATSSCTDGIARFTLTADESLAGLATGSFADPLPVWPLLVARDDLALRTFGYQHMEFALPATADHTGHGLAPWPPRPAVAAPVIWIDEQGHALLVGPLDHFHDQVMAVSSNERPRVGVACGWQGDLDEIHAGFTTTVVAFAAESARAAIAQYGALLLDHHHTQRSGRGLDPAVRGVSYWTDNGAHYYYRSEDGQDYASTLGNALDALAADGLPIHAVQLDSWFYPHETSREIKDGASVVPPSGAMRWDPRPDALPGGIDRLRTTIGDLPLVLHSRHLSADSPYFTDGGPPALIDPTSGHAHPATDDLIDAWMEQAAMWGACTYEQDWLVETFLTVDGLRVTPGAATHWQQSLDDSAARRGLTLQWCMASTSDFLATVGLRRVSSIRTSMDFKYAVGRQANWGWFLHTNALARALGLNTSKDVFVAALDDDGSWEDPLAGAEALLAALSCGPVGIGDRIGRTDVSLVMRTCRPDGVIIAPDVPVAAWSRSFATEPMTTTEPLVGESWTQHPAGRWHYVVALASEAEARHAVTVDVSDLDGANSTDVAHRWSTGEVRPLDAGGSAGSLELEPGAESFDLWTVSPLLDDRVAVFGDVSKYVSAGDRRIGRITARNGVVSFTVLGVPGECVTVTGWSNAAGPARSWLPDTEPIDLGSIDGRWTINVVVGPHGWTRVEV